MNPTTQTVLRAVLKVGGGALVAKGLTDEATAETLIGAVVTVIGVALGIFKARRTVPKTKP